MIIIKGTDSSNLLVGDGDVAISYLDQTECPAVVYGIRDEPYILGLQGRNIIITRSGKDISEAWYKENIKSTTIIDAIVYVETFNYTYSVDPRTFSLLNENNWMTPSLFRVRDGDRFIRNFKDSVEELMQEDGDKERRQSLLNYFEGLSEIPYTIRMLDPYVDIFGQFCVTREGSRQLVIMNFSEEKKELVSWESYLDWGINRKGHYQGTGKLSVGEVIKKLGIG